MACFVLFTGEITSGWSLLEIAVVDRVNPSLFFVTLFMHSPGGERIE